MTNEAGKGDTQRPTDYDKFNENFEKIFGKKSGVTEYEFNNVDKIFAEELDKYRKDRNERPE
jgi:uncharacterized HAD superfamily protein